MLKKTEEIAIRKYGLEALPQDIRESIYNQVCSAPAKRLKFNYNSENETKEVFIYESFDNLINFVLGNPQVRDIYFREIVLPFLNRIELIETMKEGDEITRDILFQELEEYRRANTEAENNQK